MMRSTMLVVLAAVVAGLATGARGPAAPAPMPDLIPLEMLARGPDVATVKVSPDGKRLALIASVSGRRAVMIAAADGSGRRLLYRDPARSIGDVTWSGDGRWLYFFQDAGGNEGYHLYRIDPEKPGKAVDLTPFAGSRVEPIASAPPPSESVAITLDRRDREWPDAYSLNLTTRTLTEQVRNTIGATDFHADAAGVVRAATAIRPDGRLELIARDAGGNWPVRYVAPPTERFRIVALTPDGRAAIARSDRAHTAERLIRIDLSSGRHSAVRGGDCGRFDVEGVRFGTDGRIAAIECVTDRAILKPGNALLGSAVEAAERAAGRGAGLKIESISADGRVIVFYTDGSNRPGRFLRWDSDGVREVAATHPQLAGAPLARSEARWLTARDGLKLLAYVTRPVGVVGPAPTVVAIHGGPWTRDAGEFASETQWLANRGYAVLQVNFRGSTGLGRATYEAGVGEFGQRMSDDIDDAVRWAVARGIARADKVCLLGGSYGGYATLVGLVREPDRYRCGVDYAGPVDLATLLDAFPPGWGPFLPRSWYRFVGDPRQPVVRAGLAKRSPLTAVNRITAPLLVFQGANDPRVTQAQSDRIVCALRRRGIAVDYLLAGNEGHSFANEETVLAVNRAVEQFLARQLGGRDAGPTTPRAEEALATMRMAGDRTSCPP